MLKNMERPGYEASDVEIKCTKSTNRCLLVDVLIPADLYMRLVV